MTMMSLFDTVSRSRRSEYANTHSQFTLELPLNQKF